MFRDAPDPPAGRLIGQSPGGDPEGLGEGPLGGRLESRRLRAGLAEGSPVASSGRESEEPATTSGMREPEREAWLLPSTQDDRRARADAALDAIDVTLDTATPEPASVPDEAGPHPDAAVPLPRFRTVLGYAWLVFPGDPDSPDLAGYPVDLSSERGPSESGDIALFVPVVEGDPGITIGRPGATFLAITPEPRPPGLKSGWDSEPAKLSASFQAENGEVRLGRVPNALRTPKGLVLRGEFQVRDEPNP